jgi:hypothetical protein
MLSMGIEPMTYSIGRSYSTTELRELKYAEEAGEKTPCGITVGFKPTTF